LVHTQRHCPIESILRESNRLLFESHDSHSLEIDASARGLEMM
jgi:hypothetical protein